MDSMSIFTSNLWTDVKSSAKALFQLPTIGLPTKDKLTAMQQILGALSTVGLSRGIPIYASSQQELGQNNIGDQIMLRSSEQGTQVITDNIAPLPREWVIKGYIASPLTVRLDWVGDYALNTTNSILAVQAIKNYFRYLRTLRAPFQFITREGEVINVLMQNYTFTDEPESEWATRVDIHLKEYIALSATKDSYNIKNLPTLGGIFGKSAQYVTAGTKAVTKALSAFIGV